MARKKLNEENVRKIQKTSRSYYVTLPVALVREFGWDSGDEVIVKKRGYNSILIEKNGRKISDFRLDFQFKSRIKKRSRKTR